MAEQLAFRHVVGQRGAVERKEGLFAARAAKMTGARQHIFAGARITDNQQRRIEHRQLARLFHHLTHFRTDRDDMLKLAVVVDRQVLQLAAHARRRFQHHHRADRQRGALFLGGVNRTRLQQEVAPRSLRAASAPLPARSPASG